MHPIRWAYLIVSLGRWPLARSDRLRNKQNTPTEMENARELLYIYWFTWERKKKTRKETCITSQHCTKFPSPFLNLYKQIVPTSSSHYSSGHETLTVHDRKHLSRFFCGRCMHRYFPIGLANRRQVTFPNKFFFQFIISPFFCFRFSDKSLFCLTYHGFYCLRSF